MPSTAELVTERWVGPITAAAVRYRVSPILVGAMVCQESAGDPWAVRVERAFFRRYAEGLIRLVRGTVFPGDDQWMAYPDFFAASYGLLQVMLPVAIERGFTFRYPTELLEPQINLDVGCRQLAWCQVRTLDTRRMLLRWNGGGDPEYAQRVTAWIPLLRQAGWPGPPLAAA